MQIFRELAGYSLGRADLVRRAMSKKKHDVMEQEREIFLNGLEAEDGTVQVEAAIQAGIPEEVARAVFDEMSSFASYAFNKSHAAAYATVAYQTAYLKCFYPPRIYGSPADQRTGRRQQAGGVYRRVRASGNPCAAALRQPKRRGLYHRREKDIRFGLLAVKIWDAGLSRS